MLRILLLGKSGQLGQTLANALPAHGQVLAFDRHEGNLEDLDALTTRIRAYKPNIIINAAAYTAVDQAEKEPEKARFINATAVRRIAEEAKSLDAWLIHYSTDYVFDGEKEAPYCETDPTHPINAYGKTKCEGEEAMREVGGKYFIFRTSWVYSPLRHNFALAILKKALTETSLNVVDDTYGVPTSTALLTKVTLKVLNQIMANPKHVLESIGIYHVTPVGETTWYGYARLLVRLARDAGMPVSVPDEGIHPVTSDFYPTVAKRPKNSRLSTDKLSQQFDIALPDWREDVIRLVYQVAADFESSQT